MGDSSADAEEAVKVAPSEHQVTNYQWWQPYDDDEDDDYDDDGDGDDDDDKNDYKYRNTWWYEVMILTQRSVQQPCSQKAPGTPPQRC